MSTLEPIMSQEIMDIAMNSVDIRDVSKSCVDECNKCLELETQLLKKKDLIENKLRIKQYFQVQDYALWDVIENGNLIKPVARTTTNANGTSTSLIPGLVTADEKTQKKNDVKAISMLLMALPNEHLMTFN
ncbi:hypothetical protein Tco_0830627 [Tanacetum coccineum]